MLVAAMVSEAFLPPSVMSMSLPPSVNSGAASLPPDVMSVGISSTSNSPSLPPDQLSDEEDMLPELGDDINAFDEDDQSNLDVEEQADLEHLLLDTLEVSVPTPAIARTLSVQQDVAEFYSPPRLVPLARQMGLTGALSLDLLSGWDFDQEWLRGLACQLLLQLQIVFVMMYPPCCIFSQLQRLWNYKKWSKEVFSAKWHQGRRYVAHAMQCAATQISQGKFFCFEHPAGASSWKLPEVLHVMHQPGVSCVIYDQCMVGLCSKVHGIPTRKRTRLLTNSPHVIQAFSGRLCDNTHEHCLIQGSEGGMRRSTWAQVYPRPMLDILTDCVDQMKKS